MKRIGILLFLAGFSLQACQKTAAPVNHNRVKPSAPDPTALDEFIKTRLLDTGAFTWDLASDDQVWTAIANNDFVLAVGYQPSGAQDVAEHLHEINLNSTEWKTARETVLDLILASEQKITPGLTANDLLAYHVDDLPVLDVRITNPATISMLRQSALVRYAEPLSYEPFMKQQRERSDSGCDGNPAESGLVSGTDYTNITPGCKQSWNHSYHKISQAWSASTGAGTTIVIVDTGVSFAQDNLGTAFNQGSSSGRTITRLVTLPQETDFWGDPTGNPETPDDLCGHGTSMAGACAAPRGTDGAASGIAYRSNLITYRAAQDVYLDESREIVGVSNAFTAAGNNTSVRVISMSMGRLTSSSQLGDAIKYAYNKGKLIFCAAGTSFSWTAWFTGVIYPASMTEAVAVTGIKDNLTTRCDVCHQGSKVDFVVVMEKASNGRNPLSLDSSSNTPSTVGGSSVATASVAGMAGLVWAKYPGWTRTQVFNRLKTSANYYPSRNSNFGWGRINAQLATQ